MHSVSVIIPLFNKQPYLEACLRSIAQQTVPASEVIVVDDGSTDGSLQLAQSLSSLFDGASTTYRVILQEHQGVSTALNAGLNAATGDYVTRVDADDLVAPRWLETLLAHALSEKPVAIRTRLTLFSDEANVGTKANAYSEPSSVIEGSDVVSGALLYQRLFGEIDTDLMSVCGMLYPRQELLNAQIAFEPTLSNTEDILFNAQYFALAKPVVIVDEPLYFYRQTSDSLSKNTRLFESARILSEKLEGLTHRAPFARVAKLYHKETLHYLGWFYTLALLNLEQVTSSTAEFTEAIEHENLKPMHDLFAESAKLSALPRLTKRLSSLIAKKQYAQLRLVARTVNLARQLRRRIIAR